ncbi:hypothetical protein M4I32_13895 [Microbacterium sp. LRZ72]|uniref:hypothetical protein n=1 Tax=Microbacterium sp. LRZ72 TaxID=2942481 RepID=UPI0029BB61F3|nr:hypothetical protein [Microbacterium sp. LRZ72]MDX2377889.1 hypothetical protein [Microbacterium sp. LRZ72]
MTSATPARTLTLIALAAMLTACAGAPEEPPEETGDPTPTVSAEPSTDATPDAGPAISPADVECADLLPENLLTTFDESGWTVKEEPFRLGSAEIADGLWCAWGDFSAAASDNVQIYGWALIDADTADDAQQDLVGEGWVREQGDDGVYITENPDTTVATDDEGYGVTYQFGDGWVIVSDTKASLLVIQRPGE